jgi:hypothetical protein
MAKMFFPAALTYLGYNSEMVELLIFIAFCFNYILVESLYVCMGFGLYINSRVEVEGWDLQILFQKFAGPAVKTILLLCLFLVFIPAAHSEEKPAAPVEYFPEFFPAVPEGSFAGLEEILASPDFGSEKESWGIKFKKSREPIETPEINFAPWMEKIKRAFGLMLRSFLVLAVLAFAGFAFYRFWKMRGYSFRRKGMSRGGVKTYTGPVLPHESLESLFAMADDFYRRGFFREAWAACFAGCMGIIARRYALSFPADATEYGCLKLVRSALPEEGGNFGYLVRNWILVAYGGRNPSQGVFEEALAYGRSLLSEPAGSRAIGDSGEP